MVPSEMSLFFSPFFVRLCLLNMQRESDSELLEVGFAAQVSSFSYLFGLGFKSFELGGEGLLGLLLVYCLGNGTSYVSWLLPVLSCFVPFCACTALVGADFMAIFLWQKGVF